MHFVDLKSFGRSDYERVLDLAAETKRDPEAFADALRRRRLYMLFQKTSTRTAVAFGIGMTELGGVFLSQSWNESNFRIGEIRDEARYVARNVDVVLARLVRHEDVLEMARHSRVPVVNGCCDRFHPSQAIADLLTIRELHGSFDAHVVYVGVWNNVANSLVLALTAVGARLTLLTPIRHPAAADAHVERVAAESPLVTVVDTEASPEGAVRDVLASADFVYTDTWVDMESFLDPAFAAEAERRKRIMAPLQLTEALLDGTRARVMHDMPIHPGYEISRAVVEAHADTILLQAENRRHAAKGIFRYLLSDASPR